MDKAAAIRKYHELERKLMKVLGKVQPFVHYGLVPSILVLGMLSEPRPSVAALVTPF